MLKIKDRVINGRLKKQLLITENGFKASTDELCEYAKENQELKSQLEEINKMIEKCGFVNIEQAMLTYGGLLTQQKEFINYLEDEINKLVKEYGNYVYDNYSEEKGKYDSYQEILQEYKEIIGVSDENRK